MRFQICEEDSSNSTRKCKARKTGYESRNQSKKTNQDLISEKKYNKGDNKTLAENHLKNDKYYSEDGLGDTRYLK